MVYLQQTYFSILLFSMSQLQERVLAAQTTFGINFGMGANNTIYVLLQMNNVQEEYRINTFWNAQNGISFTLVSGPSYVATSQPLVADTLTQVNPNATTTNTTTTSNTTSQNPPTTILTTTTPPPFPQPCRAAGPTCIDCRNLQVCTTGNGAPPSVIVPCRNQNPKRPYCDPVANQCSSTNTCIQPESQIAPSCSKVEQRPDPMNCQYYIQCINAQTPGTFTGYRLKCPGGLNYSPNDKTCRVLASCDDLPHTCTFRGGQLVQFHSDPTVYGYCPTGTDGTIQVFRCTGSYVFDETVSQCQPKCLREGNMPRNENCQQFYTCVNTGLAFSMELNTCPNSTVFNPTTQLCDFNTTVCTPPNKRLRRNVVTLLSTKH